MWTARRAGGNRECRQPALPARIRDCHQAIDAGIPRCRDVAPAGNPAHAAWGLAATNPNARLDMAGGGVETAKRNPDVRFAISAAPTVTMPAGGTTANPAATKLTLAPATGRFSGSFALVDPLPGRKGATMPRTVAYDGVLVTRAGETTTVLGYGRFQLPALPRREGSCHHPDLGGGVVPAPYPAAL